MINFEKLTLKVQEAIQTAHSISTEYGNQEISIEHLLYSLFNDPEGLASIIAKKIGASPEMIATDLLELIKKNPKVAGAGSDGRIYISNALNNILKDALNEASKLKDEYISTEHILLSAAGGKNSSAQVLNKHNITRDSILKILKSVRGSHRVTDQNPESKYQAVSRFCINLTNRATSGKLDPVIGRDDEIRRVMQVISRRTKNNPVLIGDPGVGKTAIAEGLAQRIINGDVPDSLKNKKLVVLDLGLLIAGTKFRGEFEDRLKSLIKEITDAAGEIIIFIDEIHTLVGAGSAEGAVDASNLLKPALARGDLKCIGATTIDEYRKYIEKDAALERRFQPVMINEPSVEDTIAILRGIKEKYEVHHGVRINDTAIVSAATLSNRYIADRFLPDKAVDLIDEAASKLRIEIDSMPEELDEIERKIRQLEIEKQAVKKDKGSKNSSEQLKVIEKKISDFDEKRKTLKVQWQNEKDKISKIRSIKEQIDHLKAEEQEAERNGNLARVAEIRHGKIPELEKGMKKLNDELYIIQKNNQMLKEEVSDEDIAQIVSRWTGIPVSRMLETEIQKLVDMEARIKEHVIGQDEAIDAISNAIRRSRSGLQDEKRPIGSFIFIGPTGVGKTELAKSLAEFLFDDEQAMIRLDMSEYMEKHSVAKLIGAPPGYVGYEEGGYLTESIRRKPYSVILFDEIEKAHPDVFNMLLQILDDGRLTDSQGRTVNFRNAIIIMTSNIGSKAILNNDNRDTVTEIVDNGLKDHFRPEFLNRVDEIIIFNGLSRENLKQIVEIQIKYLENIIKSKDLKLELNDEVKNYLAGRGYDPQYGARPLARLIKKEILNPLSIKLLKGEINEGDKVKIGYDKKREQIVL